MPSQPKNMTIKLSAVTNTSIKPVNNDKYDINRAWCGSPFIYSVEYKCTRDETPQTTISIVVESESKQKPQFTIKRSDDNQDARKMLQLDPKTAVS